MPMITVKTGLADAEGREEVLSEYFCDSPGCLNIATQVLGYVKEIGICAAVCEEHTPNNRTPPLTS